MAPILPDGLKICPPNQQFVQQYTLKFIRVKDSVAIDVPNMLFLIYAKSF